MKKKYLLAPGPTPVPESVTAVFAQPIIHHRTPEFEAIFARVRQGLKRVVGTEQEVITLASTGTGAMEAAVVNLFSAGDSVITIAGGKFGERWTLIARAYGLNPHEIKLEPGQSLDLKQLEKAVTENPTAKAILFQASETSTGLKLPTEAICQIARKHSLLSVCDAITACGVFALPMDAWDIDVIITGSQKALMLPPGLAFIALSARAWEASKKSTLPKFYFNLAKELKSQLKNQTAWTPAISLIQGLDESLRLMEAEGSDRRHARHEILARATRAGVQALGLELLAKDSPSESVTAVKVPTSIKDGKAIPKLMRTKYGVTITGGQDELEGKIFRLSHFGYIGAFDITTGLAALEMTLNDLGYPVKLGQGVSAAMVVIAESGLLSTGAV